MFTTVGSYASAASFVDGFAIGVCAATGLAAAIAALATPSRRPTPVPVLAEPFLTALQDRPAG